jgi:hypothetical protein
MYLGGLRQPEVKPARTILPLLWFLMPHATRCRWCSCC